MSQQKNSPTRATIALKALKAEHVKVEDNGMFNSYDHIMVCHGCGAIHAVRSAFISSPLAMSFNFADGSMLTLACNGCPSCMAIKGDENPIRLAWNKGITYATSKRAAESVGAIVPQPPQPCRLCGGTAGRLDDSGAHSLCAARLAVGQPTPCLGMAL